MTEVAFHLHVPDRLRHVCRLARKALHRDTRVLVLAAPDVQQALSALLWGGVEPGDFLAHACDGADGNMLRLSPIVLLSRPEAAPHREALINLMPDVPEGFADFARVVEVVAAGDGAGLQRARQHWKQYVAAGCQVQHHDLARP